MRTDENGDECPATLGEYLDICLGLGGPDCTAVKFLNEKIKNAPNGRDEIVLAPDSQMRLILMPLLFE
jgi:hypothetical protein